MADAPPARWIEAVREADPLQPTVLVLGGFLTSPPLYRGLERRLRERGAAAVVIGDAWTPDWLLAAARDARALLTRSGRALLEASARSAASPASLGAPVLVVGHSAGGVGARLLTSPIPFLGQRLNASGRIGAIVTLGTPHEVSDRGVLGRLLRRRAATFVEHVVPGPWFAPRVGYLAVGSRILVGRPRGRPGERAAWRLYQSLVSDPEAAEIPGDGIVPLASALLPGAPSIVFADAGHGQWPGRDWYGSDRFLDAWWPRALEAWLDALRARAAADGPMHRSGARFDGEGDAR